VFLPKQAKSEVATLYIPNLGRTRKKNGFSHKDAFAEYERRFIKKTKNLIAIYGVVPCCSIFYLESQQSLTRPGLFENGNDLCHNIIKDGLWQRIKG